MGRSNRWDYMGEPGYNPPNDDCPTCEEPSKTHHMGAKTVFNDDGSRTAITRWECEHKHEWETKEDR
jgi:hypothetical protein